MTSEQVKQKITTDPDFVFMKRYGFSLTTLLERYPEGCPDRIIAQSLLMTEEDVQIMYEEVVVKLREIMKVEV